MANDLLTALDVKQIYLLSLLDMSAAFDTIDNPFYSQDYIWHFLALLCLGFSHTFLIEFRSSLSMLCPLFLRP